MFIVKGMNKWTSRAILEVYVSNIVYCFISYQHTSVSFQSECAYIPNRTQWQFYDRILKYNYPFKLESTRVNLQSYPSTMKLRNKTSHDMHGPGT